MQSVFVVKYSGTYINQVNDYRFQPFVSIDNAIEKHIKSHKNTDPHRHSSK